MHRLRNCASDDVRTCVHEQRATQTNQYSGPPGTEQRPQGRTQNARTDPNHSNMILTISSYSNFGLPLLALQLDLNSFNNFSQRLHINNFSLVISGLDFNFAISAFRIELSNVLSTFHPHNFCRAALALQLELFSRESGNNEWYMGTLCRTVCGPWACFVSLHNSVNPY